MLRKKTGRGPFGLTEFSKELEDYYDALEERQGFFTRFKREERNVLEVCRTIGGIEGNGLVSFWDATGINQSRVIEAFSKIGCGALAELLQKAHWVKRVIKREINQPGGYYKFSEAEEKDLNALEGEVLDLLQEAAALANVYVQRHSLRR